MDDHRLIEDYLPIQPISAEASREKSVRKGRISTLRPWWTRRPLVACRAAVYGALAPASQFVPTNGLHNRMQTLGRQPRRRGRRWQLQNIALPAPSTTLPTDGNQHDHPRYPYAMSDG